MQYGMNRYCLWVSIVFEGLPEINFLQNLNRYFIYKLEKNNNIARKASRSFFSCNFILNAPVSNAWFTFDVTRPASCIHVAGNNPRNRATRKVLQSVISREERNK